MSNPINIASLRVAKVLHDFSQREALPGTNVSHEYFWNGLAGMVRDFEPRNRQLLTARNVLQEKVDPAAANSRTRYIAGSAWRSISAASLSLPLVKSTSGPIVRALTRRSTNAAARVEISLSFCELRNRNAPLVAWFLDLGRETTFGLLVAAPPCAAHNI
jgi:hypothetical protein